MIVVQTDSLSKTYQSGLFKKSNIKALSNVSIGVEAGEIFGLLGPNGAGKTTFIKILLSIVQQSSGSGLILGSPLGHASIRERSGYLPENHRYPQFLTAFDTLLHFGRLHGIRDAVLKPRAHSLLELVGLKDWVTVKVKKFSKGMLQRLGLAQALLSDPDILFLDEPTDGVDPVGRKEIRDLLTSLRSQGKTIFLNSHLLSEVELISDRVAILNKGEVLRVGTIKEITSRHLEYELILQETPSEALLSELKTFCKTLDQKENHLVVSVNAKADLDRVIDLVRKKGHSIESFAQRKSSLEDFFINLIQTGGTP